MAKYSVQRETLTSIADAVRLKNDGETSLIQLTKMKDAVLRTMGNAPSYVVEEAHNTAARVNVKDSGNTLVFAAVSDNHVNEGGSYEALTKTAVRHAGMAIEQVRKQVELDFVVNLGDNYWSDNTILSAALKEQEYVNNAIFGAFYGLPQFRLVGNHDQNNATAVVPTAKVYGYNGAFCDYDATGSTRERGYGYKDFTDKKVRVICLNTSDYWNLKGGYGMSYEQKAWFMSALDLSGKSDAANWKIVLLSHIPLDFPHSYDYNTYPEVKAILDAYVSGGTVSITVNPSYAVGETASGVISYNYSGKNSAKLLCNIHGHVHNDCYAKMANNGVYRIATPTSNPKLISKQKYEGYSVPSVPAMTPDTADETSVTVYVVNLDEEVIYSISYGAGEDRTIYVKSFSIAYNMSGCSVSNAVTDVGYGNPYTTTVNANKYHTMSSVKVTMGGVDITNSVYSNGTISIPSVTGEVVITATAVASFNNLFSTSDPDYSVGRITSSGGVNTSFTDGFVSGFIPVVKGDVIRARGTTVFGSNYPVIALYNSSKSLLNSFYVTTASLEVSGDGLEVTLKTEALGTSSTNGLTYARVMGYGNANDFIVTKNEEIK